MSHLSRPKGTYCAVCGAMLFEEEPKCCDECGVDFSFKIDCCEDFTIFFSSDTEKTRDISCLDCGRVIFLEELVAIERSG